MVKPSSPAKAAPTDWEAIERAYRAGLMSIREIAKQHGISDKAIRNKAKILLWERATSYKESEPVTLSVDDNMASTGFVYVIFIDTGTQKYYKIGMAKHFSSRFDHHRCSSPFALHVALCYFVGNMRDEESMLHKKFDAQRVRGEWFTLTPGDLRFIAQRSLLVNHD